MENKSKPKTISNRGDMEVLFQLSLEIKFIQSICFILFSKYIIPTELHLSSWKYSCNNCLQVAEFGVR